MAVTRSDQIELSHGPAIADAKLSAFLYANFATIKAIFDSGNIPYGAVQNLQLPYLAKIRKKIIGVLAGQSSITIAMFGHSLVVGAYDDGTVAGQWFNAMAYRIAMYLNGSVGTVLGCPALSESFFGDQNNFANYAHYNPRIAIGAGWSISSKKSLGGFVWQNTTTTNSLAFTPSAGVPAGYPVLSYDTVDVYYVAGAGLGTFSGAFGAGAAVNVNTGVGSGMLKATFTGALAAQTFNIRRVSGDCNIIGAIAYNGAVFTAKVLNIGQNGAKITDLIDNSNPYSWFPASAALAPDLSFVLCDINDALAGVNVQTYQANLLSYVKQLQISGTVILLASPQIKISDNPEVTQAKYRDAILAVAIATNSIMINFTIQYGSWVNMNAAGMIDDDVHPNGYGYWDMAAVISRILTGVTL